MDEHDGDISSNNQDYWHDEEVEGFVEEPEEKLKPGPSRKDNAHTTTRAPSRQEEPEKKVEPKEKGKDEPPQGSPPEHNEEDTCSNPQALRGMLVSDLFMWFLSPARTKIGIDAQHMA